MPLIYSLQATRLLAETKKPNNKKILSRCCLIKNLPRLTIKYGFLVTPTCIQILFGIDFLRYLKRLINVPKDVINTFQPNGDAYHVRFNSRRYLLLFTQLPMSR